MPDPLDPVGLTEAERLHMTNLREAWRIAAPVYTDLAATDVEWLCTIIDRLSAAPVDDREREALIQAGEALRIVKKGIEAMPSEHVTEARMIAMNERLVKERDELRAEVDRLSASVDPEDASDV